MRNGAASYSYEYRLGDQLGNNRVYFDIYSNAARQIQGEDYYPFGLAVSVGALSGTENKYQYNGKEKQDQERWYDYGARFYDPVIGRWTSVDPMGEKFVSLSLYNYVMNNPVRMFDPDGMAPEDGPTPKWWRTTVFTVSHPLAAASIGSVSLGATNISTNAARFSTRGSSPEAKGSVLNETPGMENEGTEVNAFRHTL